MLTKFIKIISLIFVCVTLVVSCGLQSIDDLKHQQRLQLTGTLTYVGNVPFQREALRIKSLDYTVPIIVKKVSLKKNITARMGKKVELDGVIHIREIKQINQQKPIKEYTFVVHQIK